MTKLHSVVPFFFDRVVLKKPRIVIVCMLAATGFLVFQAGNFRLDASAETLLLENDENLKYTRLIASRYADNDLLVLTFKPNENLFSDKTLGSLAHLRDDLKQVGNVESVLTILDVPLLQSPPIPLKEMGSTTRTLESPDVDRALAMDELKESPLYKDLLVSSDLKTTAILITFPPDQRYEDLQQRRNALRDKKAAGALTAAEQVELKDVVQQFAQYRDQVRQQRHHDILAIRSIMDNFRQDGDLFLGGMSMIADDMINFIKSDLRVFGAVVFLLLVLTIAVIFRRTYWVILPMLVCAVSVTWTIGFLGWFGWEVTVISSNFISLQLIITLAMTIHLMVRYRELAANQPDASHRELILATIHTMLRPCVYSGLTTMAGFASLVFCNIRPVVSFGYIMVVGVAISIIVPFLLLPAVLVLLPKDTPALRKHSRWSLTPMLGRFTVAHGRLIVIASAVLLIVNIVGIRRLQVENCFIDYFKSTTEIHQGMKLIDQSLGGTTPLDVIVDFAPKLTPQAANADEDNSDGVFDEFEEFDKAATDPKYWFTAEKMDRIKGVHNYLEDLPETGKVLSVVTLVKMIESANGGKPLDGVELALLFDKIPDRLRQMLVSPYVSVEHNQVRLAVRILDSDPSIKRNDLLKKIRNDLTGKFTFESEQVHLAGALVLYNNMLQSLYGSQIVTMGLATLSLMAAFVILFRSLRIACIAIFPNLLAVSCVLGTMGWLNIPLDMMTITIAAIGVGLADDDTIHYIHRFKHELETTGSYVAALQRSHDSIGHAIYYTTITLVIGFSILCLSNFIPTIYFGLFTMLTITVALLASLTLLPQLLVLLKPYGKEPKAKHDEKENDQ
jgi:predicted RND superfamily exporter protein